MEHFVAVLTDLVARHAGWAAVILGLTTFGESMVLIGAFFPATALMVTAGGLIGAGLLPGGPVLAACIIGAVLGDAVSYWLGRRVGAMAWRNRFIRPHRRKLARARLFFRRAGIASIYLCRFMGPVRAFIPLTAGMSRMAHQRFEIANVGSALIWVPAMLAPGYLAAKGIKIFGEGRDPHIFGLAAALVAVVLLGWGWLYIARRNADLDS